MDKLNDETFGKCLENYNNYSMETEDSLNEKNELEILLKNKFSYVRETAIKNNLIFINDLKQKISCQYETEMKKVNIFFFFWINFKNHFEFILK